jgi:disulfide oxidoreductase YuzD
MNIENIHKLAEYKIIDNPFDYRDLDSKVMSKYQYFEYKFEKLYLDKINRFKLKDCFFYIKNDLSCNAFARTKRGYNIIGITNGYAIQMLDAFDEKYFSNMSMLSLINLNDESIADGYSNLHKINDFRVDKFMLDCSTRFTFGHEFQHILQFNSSKIIIDNYLSENLDLSEFDIKRHAWELDADWFAMWDTLTYVLEIKNNYQFIRKKNIDKNTLICLLFLGVGSVCITKTLSYFGAWNFKQNIQKVEFYTKKYSHPHPLVRLLNIIDCFYDQVKDSFPSLNIDNQILLNNVLGIIAIYFNSFAPDKKIISNIFRDMDVYLDVANNYKDELYDVGINDEHIRALLIKRGINFELGN